MCIRRAQSGLIAAQQMVSRLVLAMLLVSGAIAVAAPRGSAIRRRAVVVVAPTALSIALARGATAQEVPRLGRFEPLRGAVAFIAPRRWSLESDVPGLAGTLSFLKNGDAELRAAEGFLLGESASAWRYALSSDGTSVTIGFTLDLVSVSPDVLIMDATLDLVTGSTLRGAVSTGRAETGARGAGPSRRLGTFSATVAAPRDQPA